MPFHDLQLRNVLWTLRYLSAKQIYWRLRRMIILRFDPLGRKLTAAGKAAAAEFQPLLATDRLSFEDRRMQAVLEDNAAVVRDMAAGTFHFLNCSHTFPDGQVDWHSSAVNQLWRYQLHYFGFVPDLLLYTEASGSDTGYRLFKGLVRSWIQSNPPLQGGGWHPYTISLRIVNWIQALHGFRGRLAADPEFSDAVTYSLARQAGYLSRDLELDVRGNHLLKNLKALIFYSLALTDAKAEDYFDLAVGRLQSECAEQVLPDGGHFERTPGYHVDVLADLIDIGLFLKRNRMPAYDWLDGSVRRMLAWLKEIVMPGDTLPGIKDTSGNGPPGVHCLDILAAGALYLQDPQYKVTPDLNLYTRLRFDKTEQARFGKWPLDKLKSHSSILADSGFGVLRQNQGRDAFIVDFGQPCPDYLPAHAHADMLSYELFIENRPVIVDSGVFEYAPGTWRDYFRSTRAHNTVALEGRNQSEVYGSFRVARRARPIKCGWSLDGGVQWVRAGHDGYRRLPQNAEHVRTVAMLPGLWIILDAISAVGRVEAASYLHLHPDLEVVRAREDAWRIDGLDTNVWVTPWGFRTETLVKGREDLPPQGWYSSEFGMRRPNWVLDLTQHGSGRLLFGYVIAVGQPAEINQLESRQTEVCMSFVHAGRLTNLLFNEEGVSLET